MVYNLTFILLLPLLQLAIESSFSQVLCSFGISPFLWVVVVVVVCVCVLFWAPLSFLELEDAPGSSCIFPAPVLELAISPRSPGSFYLINIGNQDLDVLAHCFLAFLKDSFARCKILCWQFLFSFQHLEYVIPLPLGLHFVSDEKSAVNLIGLPLYVMNCFLLLLSIYSLCLVSQHFGYEVSGHGFLCTNPLGVCWSLWMCKCFSSNVGSFHVCWCT